MKRILVVTSKNELWIFAVLIVVLIGLSMFKCGYSCGYSASSEIDRPTFKEQDSMLNQQQRDIVKQDTVINIYKRIAENCINKHN